MWWVGHGGDKLLRWLVGMLCVWSASASGEGDGEGQGVMG